MKWENMEVYAWDGDFNRLLLVGWYKPRTDCCSEIPKDPRPYPEVVNGWYKLERSDVYGILQAPWDTTLKAYYIGKAPEGRDYNEILGKVEKPLLPIKEAYQNSSTLSIDM